MDSVAGCRLWVTYFRSWRDQEAPCRLKDATTPLQLFMFHTCKRRVGSCHTVI